MSVKATIDIIEKIYKHHYAKTGDPVADDCLQVWAMNHGQPLIEVSKAVRVLLKAIDKAETLARYRKVDPEFDRYEFPDALQALKDTFEKLESWTEAWDES